MLAPIPSVRDQLVADGHYIAIIGKDQELTTLPEYSHMDSSYWDARARGLGAGPGIFITSCGEENLLCLGRHQDRYCGENILIHEFAHTIHLSGQGLFYNVFNNRLSRLYYKARRRGLWEDTYAITSPLEYWAEGVQVYFNSNLSSYFPDGVHNRIDTSEELAEYDPELYEFIAGFFDYFAWKPTCQEKKAVQ
jgi:alpha-glucosidase